MSTTPTFTLEEAVRAQRALRAAIGLDDERFPVPAFVEMISDEIEQARAAGRSDADVAAIVADVTGHSIDPADIARHYVAPADRHPGQNGD